MKTGYYIIVGEKFQKTFIPLLLHIGGNFKNTPNCLFQDVLLTVPVALTTRLKG